MESVFGFASSGKGRFLNRRICRTLPIAVGAAVLLMGGTAATPAAEPMVSVDNNSFHCITEMTSVRHFYVANLLGDDAGTLAVAKAGKGDYPAGSVLQLVPNEVMVKQQKGFSPATRDWEFFYIDVSDKGSTIRNRGTTDVNNAAGMNCFACHEKARPEFDLVCEHDHGCAALPFTDNMFVALQHTDPRCKNSKSVSAEDQEALRQYHEIVKTLTNG